MVSQAYFALSHSALISCVPSLSRQMPTRTDSILWLVSSRISEKI